MDEKIAYTIEELVERGCGSRTFLYERIGAGELRATKRGTRTVVLDPDLQAWLTSLPATTIRPRKPRRRSKAKVDNRDDRRSGRAAA